MKTIKCPKCGQPIFEDTYVCVHCQTKINTCVKCHHKTVDGTACPKCKTPYPDHFLAEVTESDLQEEKERIAQWEKFNTEKGVEEENIYKKWKEKSALNKFLGYSSRLVHGLLVGAGLIVGGIGLSLMGGPVMFFFIGLCVLGFAGLLILFYPLKNIALYIVAPLQMAKMAAEEKLNFITSYVKTYPIYSEKMAEREIFSMECTLYAAMVMTDKKKHLPYIILAAIKSALGELCLCLLGCVMAVLMLILASGREDPPLFLAFIIAFLWFFSFIYILVYTGCGTIYRREGWKLFFITYGLRRLRGMYMRKLVREWYGTYFPETYFVGTNAQYCVKYR